MNRSDRLAEIIDVARARGRHVLVMLHNEEIVSDGVAKACADSVFVLADLLEHEIELRRRNVNRRELIRRLVCRAASETKDMELVTLLADAVTVLRRMHKPRKVTP